MDVVIAVKFCGVCHSDIHVARNEWHKTIYPCVPGHEIVGEVIAVGASVTKFKPGDIAGVGCLVDSDRTCKHCRAGLQQFCESGSVPTYNGRDRITGENTFGGYSSHVVVDQDFVLKIPDNLPLAETAPLLCAGITTYSALRQWKVKPGDRVGVVGLGGLGHVGVKIAKAMGAHVVVLTSSPHKVTDALKLGADEVIVTSDSAAMKALANSLNVILDTISSDHDVTIYLDLLDLDGACVQIGIPEQPLAVPAFSLIARRRNLTGARIGGLAETQEMLGFCGQHGIVADIELLPLSEINTAYERMLRNDVKYRFVIDMAQTP
jgi:uncharacterized zinc-type alcohol dehydrogenase-like protein